MIGSFKAKYLIPGISDYVLQWIRDNILRRKKAPENTAKKDQRQ